MSTLTTKQEKFAQCIADGMTQAAAYRAAFDASKMKQQTVYTKASQLMADGKIRARVDEMRGKLVNKAMWTRERSVAALQDAIEIAKTMNSASGLTGAIKELNAMHGFNAPTQVELTGKDGAPMKVETIKRIIIDPKNADRD